MAKLTQKNDQGAKREHATFAFEDSVVLSTNIERFMAEQNYDRSKLTAVAGISRPTLNSVLNCEGDTKLSTIRKIASALGVSISELFAEPAGSGSPHARL